MYYTLLLNLRKYKSISDTLLFFFIITCFFTLSQSHHQFDIWSNLSFLFFALIFCTLLSLDKIFKHDHSNGRLDIIIMMGSTAIISYIYQQIVAHIIIYALPAIICYVALGIIISIKINLLLFSAFTSFIATVGLIFLGSIGASLQINTNTSQMLKSIIILPLSLPLWIFALGASDNYIHNQHNMNSYLVPLAFLIALTTILVIISPIICSVALRYINE